MTESIVELFACRAAESPDRRFLLERESGRSLSYVEAKTRVASASELFRKLGVQAGDRIAILVENQIEWVTAFLAAQAIDAITVPLNTRLSHQELESQIADCNPKLVLVDENSSSQLRLNDRPVLVCGEIPTHGASELGQPEDPDNPAVITYTSGTTGIPKGVVLSHRAMHLSSMTYAAIFNSDPSFATAVAVPLFHNTGFIDGLGHAIVAGGSVELFRRFEPTSIADGLLRGRYSFFIGVPTMYRRILERATSWDAQATRSHLWLAYGGAPMSATTARELYERFPQAQMVNCYGMSEATSITHYLPAHLSRDRWDAVGIPVPGTADRISEIGELEVNSPTAMLGYWKPNLEYQRLRHSNWLHTGDCATRDELGLIWITGRMDDFINRGGEKVAPLQVEKAMCQLDGVLEAVVVGIPDPDLGQVPAALIVVNNASFDVKSMKRALKDRLADYKIPVHVYCVDELPRNANGKVSRAQVRHVIAQRLE